MKKIIFIFVILISFTLPYPIKAVEPASTISANRMNMQATQSGDKKITIGGNVITRLKEKANKEIDRRIRSLNQLIAKINEAKRLSTDQKSTMAAQVQAEITNLTSLKTKIAADADIATLRTDVQSIISSYRVYLLFIPKINIISNADKILNLLGNEMATLTTKLQVRIGELSKNGVDVTTLSTLMAQRKEKMDNAEIQANAAITQVVPLTPNGWPANKPNLQEARDMLQTARKDLNDAQKIANQIRVQLQQSKPSGTPKPTITPAALPTTD